MTGLILMTALPPSVGHENLINFAYEFLNAKSNFDDVFKLHVILNSRSFEPILGDLRAISLYNQCDNNNLFIYHCEDDTVPQNPKDHPDFWNIWKNIVLENVGTDRIDYVFASEDYGFKLAEILNSHYIPFDIKREFINISGTKIRNNPIDNFKFILPEIQKLYKVKATFFGPESVGKTTMTKKVFSENTAFECVRVPEWARGYLETVGPNITLEKMLDIVHGQYSLQNIGDNILNCPFVLQDTDLLSTLGYYKLWACDWWPEICEELFKLTKSDIYFLMNDKIPFEHDILRYGGNKRETSNAFWKELLEEFNCNYYEVSNTDLRLQTLEIENILKGEFYMKCSHLVEFTRE